jgi:hypothetical protein
MRKRSVAGSHPSVIAVAILAVATLATAAQASVVFGNFEDGATDGFGALNGPEGGGVQPWTGTTPAVSVSTPTAGTDTTKVLDVVGGGYNAGQSGGTDVGYDFAANGLAAQFLANDILTFNWEVPVSSATGGYNQIYQVVLNAPGLGYTSVGGVSSADNSSDDQNPPYTGQLNTFTLNYDAYKALITANPGYLQLGIVTNSGGGAPGEIYFDNFTLSANAATPEPASCAVLGIGAVALLRRRR